MATTSTKILVPIATAALLAVLGLTENPLSRALWGGHADPQPQPQVVNNYYLTDARVLGEVPETLSTEPAWQDFQEESDVSLQPLYVLNFDFSVDDSATMGYEVHSDQPVQAGFLLQEDFERFLQGEEVDAWALKTDIYEADDEGTEADLPSGDYVFFVEGFSETVPCTLDYWLGYYA
ncbi:MAG: hypothetical protein LC623_07205 [Halobacteriales archaeon]|nr:hypothetical protein [Halobacteriales archaeon]